MQKTEGKPPFPMTGSMPVVDINDPSMRLIVQLASQLGVKPILDRKQIDGKLEPLQGHTWCEHRKLVPLRDGRLLVAHPGHIGTGREYMRSQNIPKATIVPIYEKVFAQLLDEIFDGDNESAISDLEKSDIEVRIHGLIEAALGRRASDIHVEVRPAKTTIRFREHGVLKIYEESSYKHGYNLAQVLFNVTADTARSTYNPREPQDGSLVLTVRDSRVRVRLASMPAHPDGSLDVVMRILPSDRKAASLVELGYSPQHIRLIRGALARPHGIILVAGPTGSGKSTTLAAMISDLPGDEKTITIEDPPEYELNTATQVPADTTSAAKNFASMTRATMRMDPDNIMVGEIRDEDTAQMAVRAAITGHRVFSTIHAKSAITIVTRLVDFSLERSLLADPDLLVALMYQRLAPTMCPKCAYRLADNEKAFRKAFGGLYERLLMSVDGIPDRLADVRFKGAGCASCRQTGIAGRTVVAEVIYLDQAGRLLIEEGRMSDWEAHLLQHGWQPLRVHMVEKVAAGIVSPVDAERIIGSLSQASIGASFDYNSETDKLGGQ